MCKQSPFQFSLGKKAKECDNENDDDDYRGWDGGVVPLCFNNYCNKTVPCIK